MVGLNCEIILTAKFSRSMVVKSGVASFSGKSGVANCLCAYRKKIGCAVVYSK